MLSRLSVFSSISILTLVSVFPLTVSCAGSALAAMLLVHCELCPRSSHHDAPPQKIPRHPRTTTAQGERFHIAARWGVGPWGNISPKSGAMRTGRPTHVAPDSTSFSRANIIRNASTNTTIPEVS